MKAASTSSWHHAALVFALGSFFGSILMGSGPSPAPAGCFVDVLDCRQVDGFCVAQTEQGTEDPNKRLRVCDNGIRSAAIGEFGRTLPPLPQTRIRRCYCFVSTLVAPCDTPQQDYEKLSSCGTNGHNQCCYGRNPSPCDTLHNSYQTALSPDFCEGSSPANP